MRLGTGGLVFLGAALGAAPLRAHDIRIDYFARPGGWIRIEVFYPLGDRPAQGAEVVVRDASGAEVARGVSDQLGGFEFAPPPGAILEVEALHEGGHRTVRRIDTASVPAGPMPRDRRSAVPWGALGAGLLIIAGLALGARWVLRRRRAS